MPAVLAPRYCCQKEKGRPDRAYVCIAGKRISLGNDGTPESYKKYAQLINGELKQDKPVVAEPAQASPTMSVLMADYLAYSIRRYGGERVSEVIHTKGVFRILRQNYGSLLAKDFGPKASQQLRLAMIDADWSRSYIRDQCRATAYWLGCGRGSVTARRTPCACRNGSGSYPTNSHALIAKWSACAMDGLESASGS